jgi:hypothetical protein
MLADAASSDPADQSAQENSGTPDDPKAAVDNGLAQSAEAAANPDTTPPAPDRAPASVATPAPASAEDAAYAARQKFFGLGQSAPVQADAAANAAPDDGSSQAPGVAPASTSAPVSLASDAKKPAADPVAALQASGAYTPVADIKKTEMDALNAKQDAAIQGAAAGIKEANANAFYLKQAADQQEKFNNEAQLRESNRQAQLKQAGDTLNQAVLKYSSNKIDPNSFWENRTTGQQVSLAIGAFLGAFDPHGNNTAVAMLNNAMNRDIEAQKANIDVQGNVLKANQSVYDEMRARFGDERQAEAATRLAMLNQVQLKLQETSAQYKGPQIQAQAAAGNAAIEQEKAQALMNFNQAALQSAQFMKGDDTVRGIAQIPKEFQSKAMEEYGSIQKTDQTIKGISDIYQKAAGLNTISTKIPIMGIQRQSQLDAFNTGIRNQVMNSFGANRPSDVALDNLINPNLSKLTDSQDTANAKLQNIIDIVRKNAPATPTLTGYGLVKPTVKVTKK